MSDPPMPPQPPGQNPFDPDIVVEDPVPEEDSVDSDSGSETEYEKKFLAKVKRELRRNRASETPGTKSPFSQKSPKPLTADQLAEKAIKWNRENREAIKVAEQSPFGKLVLEIMRHSNSDTLNVKKSCRTSASCRAEIST